MPPKPSGKKARKANKSSSKPESAPATTPFETLRDCYFKRQVKLLNDESLPDVPEAAGPDKNDQEVKGNVISVNLLKKRVNRLTCEVCQPTIIKGDLHLFPVEEPLPPFNPQTEDVEKLNHYVYEIRVALYEFRRLVGNKIFDEMVKDLLEKSDNGTDIDSSPIEHVASDKPIATVELPDSIDQEKVVDTSESVDSVCNALSSDSSHDKEESNVSTTSTPSNSDVGRIVKPTTDSWVAETLKHCYPRLNADIATDLIPTEKNTESDAKSIRPPPSPDFYFIDKLPGKSRVKTSQVTDPCAQRFDNDGINVSYSIRGGIFEEKDETTPVQAHFIKKDDDMSYYGSELELVSIRSLLPFDIFSHFWLFLFNLCFIFTLRYYF